MPLNKTCRSKHYFNQDPVDVANTSENDALNPDFRFKKHGGMCPSHCSSSSTTPAHCGALGSFAHTLPGWQPALPCLQAVKSQHKISAGTKCHSCYAHQLQEGFIKPRGRQLRGHEQLKIETQRTFICFRSGKA